MYPDSGTVTQQYTGYSWKSTMGKLSLPLQDGHFPPETFSNHDKRDLWPMQRGPGQIGPGYPSTSFLYARLKNGTYYAVAMSVRPSVRPRFPGFSSTCFEISIWNLVYTFSRWHDMSSLSCITIGSFWPSLQPKVGQTHFLQSWPHKSK